MNVLLSRFKHSLNYVASLSRSTSSRPGIAFWFQKGDTASTSRTFSGDDIRVFAELSGDTNPLHIDEEYAAKTRYGQRVVHGVLINGLVSSVMGTKLPGHGTIVLSEFIEFHKPLFVGEEVVAEVEVIDITGLMVKCAITCQVPERSEVVMTGVATVLAPRSARKKKPKPTETPS